MAQGLVDAGGIVFPIRQQVDGQEVHGRRHFRVLQPELPDIRISHRLLYLGLDLLDQLGQLGARDFLAQQGLVTDYHRLHHVRVGVGGLDQGVDFLGSVHRVAVHPGAQHQLETVLACQFRDGFQAGHGVGAHTVEAGRQQGQVSVHALGAQHEGLVEGRLVLVEGAVGRALQLVAGRGGVRQDHRLAQAVPEARQGKEGDQAGKQVGECRETGVLTHG
ncbi:hypothetical protein D3C84_499610 [compost metagenome]